MVLRKLAIRRISHIDHWFRIIEFFLLTQFLAIPAMIYIQITGKTFETTRIVPNILRHIYGTEIQISGNIPQDKNCIIVCNHQSGLDIWPLLRFIPIHGTVITKTSLSYSLGFVSVVLRQLGLVFIDRKDKENSIKTLQSVKVRLENDKELFCTVIFPEGTRGNGVDLLPFKLGAFHMSCSTGVPIIPLVIAPHCQYAGKSTFPISILDPIESTKEFDSELISQNARNAADLCRDRMQKEFSRLNALSDVIG